MVCLKGNHETLVTHFLTDPTILSQWKNVGGLTTLMSYGVVAQMSVDETGLEDLAAEFVQRFPDTHRRFVSGLPIAFTCGDFLFVHAGVRPGIALAEQRERDLLWIREEFLLHRDRYGKIIVHGHTPVMAPEILSNRINIDTGAYATGQLTCLVLDGDEMRFLQS
jgi:serine/threonine protein phosphatase 1